MTAAPAFTLTSLGRFNEIPAASLSPEQADVAGAFTKRRGSVPGPFRIFLSSAPLAARLMALSDYVLRNGVLSQREVETAVLVVAHRLDAPFVQAAHRKIAASAGIEAEAIEAILAGRDPAFADGRQQAIYECAAAMLDRKQNDTTFSRITSVLGHDGVVEVAAVLGFYCTCGFTLGFYEVPPPAAP
jgi:4-carboxymuconolactone decarboxylase